MSRVNRYGRIKTWLATVMLGMCMVGCGSYEELGSSGIEYKNEPVGLSDYSKIYLRNKTESSLSFKYRVSSENMGYSTENGTDLTLAGHEETVVDSFHYGRFWIKVWDVRPSILSN